MNRYSIPLDAVPVASLVVQLDGTIAGASPAATRLLGDVVGQAVTKLAYCPAVRWSALFKGGGGGSIEDGVIATREGQQPFRLYVNQVALEDSKLVWIVVIERANPKDPANQRLESLGLVAGGIAHDFNNLLVGVLAEASAAREEALSEGTREALRRIEASARRMAQLTRQLLAFAGRAQFVTVPVDADEMLSDSRDSLTHAVRGELVFSINAGAPRAIVEADPHLLRQVLANLVSNAADAAHTRVEVSTRLISRDAASYWQLEVADDGPGIDASVLPRIFEPFFSTKSGHHGLGLSAVHGIVRRFGGDVEVDTHGAGSARGSRFRVRLPIAVGVELAPQRSSAELLLPSSRLTGIRALVADDEPSVRATVRRLLERRGATVVVAADGNEAEAHLRDEQFSLVITDVAMPGATGWEVLSIARVTQPGVRVVLMSGYTEKLRGTGSEDEPDAFLEKPFTAKGLDATIDEVLK